MAGRDRGPTLGMHRAGLGAHLLLPAVSVGAAWLLDLFIRAVENHVEWTAKHHIISGEWSVEKRWDWDWDWEGRGVVRGFVRCMQEGGGGGRVLSESGELWFKGVWAWFGAVRLVFLLLQVVSSRAEIVIIEYCLIVFSSCMPCSILFVFVSSTLPHGAPASLALSIVPDVNLPTLLFGSLPRWVIVATSCRLVASRPQVFGCSN